MTPAYAACIGKSTTAGLRGGVQGGEGVHRSAVCSNTSLCWINREVVPAADRGFPKGCYAHCGCWAHPLCHQSTGSVNPCAVSVERHGRVQSRTPILGPDRALLALGPSANRKSINLAKYILLLPHGEYGNLYTNQARRLVSPCFTAGSCRLPACLPTQRQRNGRPRGEIQVPAVSRSHQQLTAFGSFPELFRYKCVLIASRLSSSTK